MVFTHAKHLHCFLHFKSNSDDRLKKSHIPKSRRVEFLHDGNPTEIEEGLIDAEDEEFFKPSLCSLQKI